MKSTDVVHVMINMSLVTALVILLSCSYEVVGQCGSCEACTRRYGCMTQAWGQCCTQFYMHNGKRSAPPTRGNIDRVIEFIRLRSQEIVQPDKLLERNRFRRPP